MEETLDEYSQIKKAIFEYKQKSSLRSLLRWVFAGLLLLFVGLLIWFNLAPFGLVRQYKEGDRRMSKLGPDDRVMGVRVDNTQINKQIGDVMYFSTDVGATKFDKAKVKIIYQNPSPDQEIFLGYKDRPEWHYETKLIDSPILNSLNWKRAGDSLMLYQRNDAYKSIDEFFSQISTDEVVGTYNLSPNNFFIDKLPDYSSSSNERNIELGLRGKHTMYVYLENEPFNMSFHLKDLNWYEGKDKISIGVYFKGNLIKEATSDDDENDSADKRGGERILSLEFPEKGLTESGVYKVVVDSTQDTILTNIVTTIQKIVFAGQIYLTANNEVYPEIYSETKALNIYSNSKILSFLTHHPNAIQEIMVDGEEILIEQPLKEVAITNNDGFNEIKLSKNDLIIKGITGFFSFTKEQFFEPTKYIFLPIDEPEYINLVDFILTDYITPQIINGWKVAEVEFNLDKAFINNGKLEWMIQSPDLKANNGELFIKDLQIELIKEPSN